MTSPLENHMTSLAGNVDDFQDTTHLKNVICITFFVTPTDMLWSDE